MASSPKRGMGRGLAAILPQAGMGDPLIREVPIGLIQSNPNQPRKTFSKPSLDALAESIASEGLLQPLVVQALPDERFELIAGERRWRAARQAGLSSVMAVVRETDEDSRLRIALVENMVREDLSPVEEARACAMLVEDLGMSKEALARSLGRSRAAVSNLIRILDLPDPVLELVGAGELSEGHGRAILRVRDDQARLELGRQAAAAGLSVREVESRARRVEEGTDGATAKRSPGPSADERDAMVRAGDQLSGALGHEVTICSRAGRWIAEIAFDQPAEADRLARRLAG